MWAPAMRIVTGASEFGRTFACQGSNDSKDPLPLSRQTVLDRRSDRHALAGTSGAKWRHVAPAPRLYYPGVKRGC
jgi:hypothetical protein